MTVMNAGMTLMKAAISKAKSKAARQRQSLAAALPLNELAQLRA
jgi:hypothetical protein